MRRHRGLRVAIIGVLAAGLVIGSPAAVGRTRAAAPIETAVFIYNLQPTTVVNQSMVVNAWVSATVDGGTIELKIDGVSYDTKPVAMGGFTQFPWTPDTKKTYTLQVFYSGTPNFTASQSDVASITVIPPYPTSVTIAGAPNPVQRNEAFVLTATVSPNPGPGNVEWRDGNHQVVATTPLEDDGTSSWTTSEADAGEYSFWAQWLGNDNYSPRATDNFQHIVVLGDGITVSVSIPGAPVPPGDVTATVTLTANPGGGALRWRLCEFCAETEVTADADGTTSIDLGTLTFGSYDLYVRYPANGNWAKATGHAPFDVWNPTSTTLVTDRATAYVGELPVKLTATVALDAYGQGTITFLDDVGGVVQQLGPVAINAYTYDATFSSSSLRVGTHSITARYSGMPGKLGSTSGPVMVVVNADAAVHATFAPALTTFYPSKDGFKDTVKLGGVLSERATVTIKVYSSAGTLKRSWSLGTRNAGAYGVSWNGKTAGGSALPAGKYTAKAYLKDTHGHSRTIAGSTTISWRQVVWKSVSVGKYAKYGTYYVSTFGGWIYYSPDYANGRILDSGEMIRDCTDCGFAAGQFVFSVVSTGALAYRHLYIEIKGHGFSDREHPGSHALVDPRTGHLALINGNYEFDDPDVHWGIPFSSSYIDSTHHIEAWVYMDQAWGDAYDLNWLRLTYQYAVWK